MIPPTAIGSSRISGKKQSVSSSQPYAVPSSQLNRSVNDSNLSNNVSAKKPSRMLTSSYGKTNFVQKNKASFNRTVNFDDAASTSAKGSLTDRKTSRGNKDVVKKNGMQVGRQRYLTKNLSKIEELHTGKRTNPGYVAPNATISLNAKRKVPAKDAQPTQVPDGSTVFLN